MKDLYKRLGVPAGTESQDSIQSAISSLRLTDPATARACEYILTEPQRKAIYDKTHTTLRTIGQLRANLGLSRSKNWSISHCSDFDVSPAPSRSDESIAAPGPQPQILSLRFRAILVGALFLAGLVFIGKALQSESSSRSTTPPRVSNPANQVSPRRPPSITSVPATPPPRANLGIVPAQNGRAFAIRRLLTHRLTRAGITMNTANMDLMVQDVLQGNSKQLPRTGVLTQQFLGKGVAPLEIKTKSGSNYYVKVLNWSTHDEVITAFIRGGEPFETLLPVGSYEIRYAAGTSWFGPLLDFGDRAAYSKCDDRFEFTATADGFHGYTLELILQVAGNLEVDEMRPEDF